MSSVTPALRSHWLAGNRCFRCSPCCAQARYIRVEGGPEWRRCFQIKRLAIFLFQSPEITYASGYRQSIHPSYCGRRHSVAQFAIATFRKCDPTNVIDAVSGSWGDTVSLRRGLLTFLEEEKVVFFDFRRSFRYTAPVIFPNKVAEMWFIAYLSTLLSPSLHSKQKFVSLLSCS